jgi:hypothetical protein
MSVASIATIRIKKNNCELSYITKVMKPIPSTITEVKQSEIVVFSHILESCRIG